MKILKVFYNGVPLKEIYPYASKWQVIKYNVAKTISKGSKIALYESLIALAVIITFSLGATTIEPLKVYADREVIKEVSVFPPILEKICQAESGGRQFNKNGDVLRGAVNKSDIGYCQLQETIWNDKARKMGYDIYTEQGNKDMALWIFNHYGSEPWYLSKKNWNK